MRTMLVIFALLAAGTAAGAGFAYPTSYDYPWCASMVGSSAIPATALNRRERNAWRPRLAART
jgi:hypothetical protein